MSPHVERPARSRAPSIPRPAVALRLAVLALGLAGATSAAAAPCSGFADVDSGSAFCANVEWVRNRGITLGCTATQFCPAEPVSRLQMATFMRRLGAALQPAFLNAHQYVSNVTGDGSRILCQVVADPAPVPRIATPSSVVLTYHAGAGGTVFAGLVLSEDQGATWTYWSHGLTGQHHPAGGIGSQSPAAPPRDVPVGTGLRFGIKPLGNAGGPLIEDLDCEVTIRLDAAAT